MHSKYMNHVVPDNVCTNIDTTENPSSGVQLEPVVWGIIGFAVGVTLTVLLCLLFACCYKAKRKRYDVQQGRSKPVFRIGAVIYTIQTVYYLHLIVGAELTMVENPGAADIWTNDLDDKHGSSSKLDPIELTSTTTF